MNLMYIIIQGHKTLKNVPIPLGESFGHPCDPLQAPQCFKAYFGALTPFRRIDATYGILAYHGN